ncbi:MAG: hypothetical protein ABWZ99_17035 [Ilumatobacteraceae bacterium]
MRADRGGWASLGAVLLTVVAFGLAAGCGGDDDDGGGTLVPLDVTPDGSAPTVASPAGIPSGAATTVDPALAGTGFVSIDIQLPTAGVDETLSLDRATVRTDQLDPVSLDARCSALDGGADATVSIVDLRRLDSEARLVSVAIHVDGDLSDGSHDATIDVSAADQVTTSYAGTVELAEGGMTGSFTATDAAGNTATGSFVCAVAPGVLTTEPPVESGSGEVVPGSTAPEG